MRRILLATHGEFATGILSALELLLGKSDNVQALCAYVDPVENFSEKVERIVSGIEEGDELIVITDILGGSVNNEFMRYLDHSNLHLISGLNLPMLIELALNQEPDTEQMISDVVAQIPSQVRYCNQLVIEEGADEF